MPIQIDRLLRTRRKTIALLIEPDGRLTVRAPLQLPDRQVQRFVETHAEWILKTQARARAVPPPPVKQYLPGETFLFLGKAHPLSIVPHQRPALRLDQDGFHLARAAQPKAEQTFIRWYRAQALQYFTEQSHLLARQHGFQFQKIRISSARTRWGSCSSNGTLSFTWHLVLAPPEVAAYVILHELVHTRIRNHSKEFWARLGELLPDYPLHRRWLKQNGRLLL